MRSTLHFRLAFLVLLLCCCTSTFAQPTLGLLQYEPAETYPAYTLFSNNETTYLIDNCGLTVQQWQSEYRPGRAVYLLPNGQLLRTAELPGAFPISGHGGRLELFSWEGDLLWEYELNTDRQQTHHDVEPLPNGNILCIVWEKFTTAEAAALGSTGGGDLWSEAVLELKPMGQNEAEVVWEWHLYDHLLQNVDASLPNYASPAEEPGRVDVNYLQPGTLPKSNWVHLNAVDYDEELDQILLSSRLFSELWIVDHSTSSAEAATDEGGRWGRGGELLYRFGNPATYGSDLPTTLGYQHDGQFVRMPGSAGWQFMVFNNEESETQSSIKRWKPTLDDEGAYRLPSSEAELMFEEVYTAPNFYSSFMSGVQLLPGGHLLVCEGMSGRFFELNAAREIVWEYLNPVSPNGGPAAQGATVRVNQTFRATKYGVDYSAFAGKELSPGEPVETSPLPSDCFVLEPSLPFVDLAVTLAPNVVTQTSTLYINQLTAVQLDIYNLAGQLIAKRSLRDNLQYELDFGSYPSGMYLLVFTDLRGERLTQRVVKI